MAPAAEALQRALERVEIRAPRCEVVANVTARPHSAAHIATLLAEQLTSPVRWSQSCQWMVGSETTKGAEYHELAPGKTLMGLMRRIDKSIKVITHDEP
jgi:malonyl CoA-acyl carrier protein transacylase